MHDQILTLSLAAAIGIVLVVSAQRLMVPSIVLLLGGGILLGPEVLGWVQPESLGHGLETIVALTIAVILFEGGLTLNIQGYRQSSITIRRLLTIGPLVTWGGISAAVYFLYDVPVIMALMIASLVIVTGPTVVLPILRRIRVQDRLHHVLYWEAVLIDVVGVFIAVMCYEWMTPGGQDHGLEALGKFGGRIVLGGSFGAVTGLLIAHVLRREWVLEEHVNIFVFGVALLVFGVAHAILPESGILAVVVAGLVVALRQPPNLKRLKRFKLQITEVGIGTIFVLLAASLDIDRFTDPRLLILLVLIMLVIRPVVVLLSTFGRGYGWRENAFLSWIAPRGIVAASMASLFSLRLAERGYENADLLETVAYAVVIVTVTLQGLTAPLAAKLLKVGRSVRRTWVLLGDGPLVEALGSALRKGGVKTVEIKDLMGAEDFLSAEEPRFNDTHAVLFADITMLSNVWAAYQLGFDIKAEHYYRWATFEPDQLHTVTSDMMPRQCVPVWHNTVTSAIVSAGVDAGHQSIDLVEVGSQLESGRFGNGLLPLMWLRNGQAKMIENPLAPGEPWGDMAVVLRRQELGLKRRLGHVEMIDDGADFKGVLERLAISAKRQLSALDMEQIVEGVYSRAKSMPVSIGGGIAIPHAYWDGVATSTCFLGVVPGGVPDLKTPDDQPVRLVFLLLTPPGMATEHLETLGTIAAIAHEPEFVDLLCRQRVPARIVRLITERG